MSFHYHLDCDRCGKRADGWDNVPEDWIEVRVGVQSRQQHFCPACVEHFKMERFIVTDDSTSARFDELKKHGNGVDY